MSSNPGFDDGGQFEKATAGPDPPLRQRQPVVMTTRNSEAAHDLQYRNCWDNSPVERFFGSLKREWTGDRWYRTRQEAIADVV